MMILTPIIDQKVSENDLRQQLYFTQTLLDAIPSPVFFKDKGGHFLGCNKAYEDFRGITKENLRGKCVFDIAVPEDAAALHAMDLKLLSGSGSQTYATSLLQNSGSRREVIYHKACFKNMKGEAAGLICVIQDITAQKTAENAVKSQNDELERRVLERTRSLEDANYELGVINRELELRRSEAEDAQKMLQQLSKAAEEANRSKSEFLANMSHEIRTPLSAIIGFSDLALQGNLPPRQHEYVRKIQTAGDLLLKIINDILDFSKIEAGYLEIEQIPFGLDSMLANVSTLVQQKALDKGVNLLIKTSPEIAACLIGDPLRLGQIIVNLLSNAVKFTEHGEVALETTLLGQENDRIELKFTVRDSGIGIPADQIKRLFQPFTQADGSTTRRFGGTGLGLSISKQLTELMGGKIWCESVPGAGSRFCFTAWFGIGQASDIEPGASAGTTVNGNDGAAAGSVVPATTANVKALPVDLASVTPVLKKLHGYIIGRDCKAERYLDDFENEVASLPDHEVGQIKTQLKNFDFAAAYNALLSLSASNGIKLTSDGTENSF